MLGMAPGVAPPRPPPRPAEPKPPAPPTGTSDPYLSADLPAVSAEPGASDLPAPARPKPAPTAAAARAPEPRAASSPATDDDLPAIPSARAPDAFDLDVDLPAVAGGIDLGGMDLPAAAPAHTKAELPASRASDLELDLPDVAVLAKAPRGSSGTFDLDLPDLPDVGLPSAGARVASRGDSQAGLPAIAAGLPMPSAGLPMPSAGLPMPSAGLPMPSAGLPMQPAGLPTRAGELPVAAARAPSASMPAFGELDFDLGPAARSPSGSFGEIELPPVVPSARPGPVSLPAESLDPLEADPFGEAPIPSHPPGSAAAAAAASQPAAAITRSSGGGTSYGEVNLDGGGGSGVDVDAPLIRSLAPRPDEDMEFGAVPQEGPKAAATALQPGMPAIQARQRPRWPLRVFGGLLLVAVAGGSLSFVPALGPYGSYWISDRLHAGEHARLLADSAAAARKAFGQDGFPDAQRALDELERAQAQAKRVEPLAAYLAFAGYLSELRFGKNPAVHAHASVLLAGLRDPQAAYADWARAAGVGVDGPAADAVRSASALAPARPGEVDLQVLLAEVQLRAGDAAAAVATWERVEKLEASARAAFGAARAKLAAGDGPAAATLAKLALTRHPAHVGARLLIARVDAQSRAGEAQGVATIEALLKNPQQASPDEIVAAETLLGDIGLARGQVAVAEAAYVRALKVSPTAAPALVGLGEALFRSGRHADALARFEAASQADAKSVPAQVGTAKSKLMLERIEDATRLLAELTQAAPTDPVVAFWYGRSLEAAGDRDRANAIYRKVIDTAPPSPELVNVYVALATLQNARGQAEDAQKTLVLAKQKLPESGPVHRALGHLALEQARLPEAISELERALAVDNEDLAARFDLGVALRRSQKYEDATRAFDAVAKADKEHPGLALERGLIFEATGHAEEALKAYESALAKAPNDSDLMLRVGCGSVSAGRAKAAEELLRKVLMQRPNVAEVNHCLGRSLLAQDKVADAQRLFDRAVELDPRRAEYHLHAGWAANEAGNAAKAERELAAALALDGSLADAYWQRGVLRQHQGAVRDAVLDLLNALKLNPARSEAHAALADAYYDLGREREALGEWQKAVAAQPDNAVWRFRYGKLLVTNQMNDAGRGELEKAVAWAEKQEQPPRWLWEAHHFLARALAGRAEAASHWEQFLRLGPRDSPYRAEAKAALAKLGRPWSGD
jgi:tetratricopeptide (TPR) repeat protein